MVGSREEGGQRYYSECGCTLKREGGDRQRRAMVIPAGHGPIPKVVMLSKDHKRPAGGPPGPCQKKKEVKRASGKAGERGSQEGEQ